MASKVCESIISMLSPKEQYLARSNLQLMTGVEWVVQFDPGTDSELQYLVEEWVSLMDTPSEHMGKLTW